MQWAISRRFWRSHGDRGGNPNPEESYGPEQGHRQFESADHGRTQISSGRRRFYRQATGKKWPLEPLFGWNSYAWSDEQVEVTRFEVPDDLQGWGYTLTALGLDRYSLQDPDGIKLFEGTVGQETQVTTPAGKVQIFVRDLIAHEGNRFTITRWPRAEMILGLQERLKVAEQGKQSGVIGITVQGPKAKYVADVIQQIEDAYVRQNVERRSAEAEQSLEFLQQQLPEIKARVDAAQAKLNTYQQSQGSVNVTKETELVLQQSVELETKKLELIGQRQQAIQRFTPSILSSRLWMPRSKGWRTNRAPSRSGLKRFLRLSRKFSA